MRAMSLHMNLKSFKKGLGFVGTVIGGVALVVGFVSAATTISTDVTTAGSMYASTTVQTAAFTNYGISTLTGVSYHTGAMYASSTLQVSGLQTNYGNLTLNTTATTTVSLLSSSASKGTCFQFNATSTNTVLNMTFAASTTAWTTVGVAPIISYGACN